MVAVHAVVVAIGGSVATALLVRGARRGAVTDRLRAQAGSSGRRLPGVVRAPLARALHDAAFTTTPEQAVEMWLFACVIATVVGFGLAPVAGVLAAVAVIAGGPVGLGAIRHRRARLLAAAVPEALERVGAELRVGGTVTTALDAIARDDGPLAPDLARVDTRVRLGASLPDALQVWAKERRVAGVEATAGALALSATVGGSAADALDGLASSLRDRLAVVAEARALSAQARYSAWVIGVAPVGYLVVSAAVDPRSMHSVFGTAAGRLCAAVAIGLELLGAAWMRAIVRGGDAS